MQINFTATTNAQSQSKPHSARVRRETLSVMFIDVVGFSRLTKVVEPEALFEHLAALLKTLRATVTEFGGRVDKNLGDGLLCIFDETSSKDNTNHAAQALNCAIRIQSESFPRMLTADAKGEPIFPLRIGINTCDAFVGGVGTADEPDIAIIGDGVNFAKRLEAACETGSILIGQATQELVSQVHTESETYRKRLIQVKHEKEFIEVFEIDPYDRNPRRQSVALDAFRRLAGFVRESERVPTCASQNIDVTCALGPCSIIDFSKGGLGLSLPQLLTKGAIVKASLDTRDGTLHRHLAKSDMQTVDLEVRWAFRRNGENVHGLCFRHMTPDDRDVLYTALCAANASASHGPLQLAS